MLALQIAHVLHDAQHGHVDALEHAHPTEGIANGHLLRRRHDHCAMHERGLYQGELRVTRAWRHVDDQVIELTPHHVGQELANDFHHDWPAPDRGLVPVDQQPETDDLEPVRFEGNHLLPLLIQFRRMMYAQHARKVRPIDVGIHEADPSAIRRESDRQVNGHRRLPDPAFSAGHRDDVAQVRICHGGRRRGPRRGRRLLIHHRQWPAGTRGGVSHWSSRLAVPEGFAALGRLRFHVTDLGDSQLQVRRDALHECRYRHLRSRDIRREGAE